MLTAAEAASRVAKARLSPQQRGIANAMLKHWGEYQSRQQLWSAVPSRGVTKVVVAQIRRMRPRLAPQGLCVEARRSRLGGFRLRALGVALGLLLAVPAAAHSPYSGLKVPGTGESCCSDRDCEPGEYRINPETDEEEVRRAGGQWWPLDYRRVLQGVRLPDGGIHVCANSLRLLCVILPQET